MSTPHPGHSLLTTIKRWLGRQHKQAVSEAPNRALDSAIERVEKNPQNPVPSVPSVQTKTMLPERVSPLGIALIKRFEGCARLRTDGMVEAYPDPASGAEPWTIGWGSTGADLTGAGRIGPGTVWTQKQCDERFERDLGRYAAAVKRAIGAAPTTQAQFDALVSFHYNTGAIARATLTRKHCSGDYRGAAREFARWNRAGGHVLRGLTRRRAAEAKLYSGEASDAAS